MVSGALRAIAAASSSTARATSAGSASRVTTPLAAASAASMNAAGDEHRPGPRRSRSARRAARSSRTTVRCRACARSARRSGPRASTRADRTRARSRSRRRRQSPPPGRSSGWPRARAAPRTTSRRRSYCEAVLARRERGELADVGAGAERRPGRANDERPKLGRRVDPLAGVDQRVVHRPRHRVAGLRPVDGEERDGTARLEDGC